MFKKISFTLFLLAFALYGQALAQETVSVEKQAAVKELIALVNAENRAEDLFNAMSAQMDESFKASLKASIEARDYLSAAEKATLEESLVKDFSERTKRFRERLMQKLDYNQMINEIAAAAYDKYFTLEEIRDLVAFYKSPTGQKSLKMSSAIMTDTIRQTQEKIIPKIPVILKELQDEDKAEIEQKINARKPKPNKMSS